MMKKNLIQSASFVALVPALLQAADEKITWDDHIFAIMEESCVSCHNPDKAKGGLDLASYNNMMKGGSSGTSVTPGDPSASMLYKTTAHLEEPFMPKGKDKLPQEQIELIGKWISGGLLETSSSKAKKAGPSVNIALSPDAATGKPDGKPATPEYLAIEPVVVTERAAAISAIATSNWAPVVAVAGQKQVLLYDTDTLLPTGALPYNEGFIESLKFSPNGSLLIAGGGRGGKSGRVVAWDVKSGKQLLAVGQEYDAVLGADISADHAYIALGSPGKRIKILNTTTGENLHNIKKHSDWVTAVSFSPDGVLLATGDRQGGVYIWEAFSGNLFYSLEGHNGSITGLSWRIDSNAIATACEDGSVRLFAMSNGREYRKWTAHGGGVLSIHFGSNGQIATSGRDKQVKTWGQDAKQIKALPAFKELPLEVAFSHNGKQLIVGDWNGEITVWDSAEAKQIGTLSANPPTVATRIKEAEVALNAAKEVTAKAKQALDAAKAATAASAKAFEDAKSAVALKTKEKADADANMNKAKSDAANADKARADSLAMLDGLKKAHAALVESIKPHEAALAKAQGEENKWKAELAARKAETDYLKTASDRVVALAKKSTEDKSLQAASAKAAEALQAMQASFAESEKQTQTAATQIKSSTDQITSIKNKVAESDKAVQTAQADYTQKDANNKTAATAFAESTKVAIAKAAELKTSQDNQAKADAAFKDQSGKEKAPADAFSVASKAEQDAANILTRWKAEQFNLERHKAISAFDSKVGELASLKAAHDAAKAGFDQAQGQVISTEKQKADIPAKVDALSKELEQQKQKVVAESQKLGNLNRAVMDKEEFLKKFDALAGELDGMSQKDSGNGELSQAAKDMKEGVRQQLVNDLGKAKSSRDAQNQTVEVAQNEVTSTEGEMNKLKAMPAELDKQIQSLAKTRDELKAKYDSARTAFESLSKEQDATQAKVAEMTKQYLAMLPNS